MCVCVTISNSPSASHYRLVSDTMFVFELKAWSVWYLFLSHQKGQKQSAVTFITHIYEILLAESSFTFSEISSRIPTLDPSYSYIAYVSGRFEL